MKLNAFTCYLISVIFFFSYSFSINAKYKYSLESKKANVKNNKENSYSNSNSIKKKQIFPQYYQIKHDYSFPQAFNLLKQIAHQLFVENEQGLIDFCIDNFFKNTVSFDSLLKNFWIKMNDIYYDYQRKKQSEFSSKLPSTNTVTGTLVISQDWKDKVIGEFQTMVKHMDSITTRKSNCEITFSNTQRNFYDLLFILQDTKFFGKGFKFEKNDQFIVVLQIKEISPQSFKSKAISFYLTENQIITLKPTQVA